VLDADALNLLAAHPVLAAQAADARRADAAHAASAGSRAPARQRHRRSARRPPRRRPALAAKLKALVVLKGCGSVIAGPDGRWFINTSGNPGMASAGMGDVLAGIAAALLAQGWEAEAALLCAVHLHGVAADRLVGQGIGPIGLTADETIDAARRVFNAWIHPGDARRRHRAASAARHPAVHVWR
jgi:NAD(P)H-hydrate repair Nnr-like enzyme with NAD(P)H-hydrate dehydratase domain